MLDNPLLSTNNSKSLITTIRIEFNKVTIKIIYNKICKAITIKYRIKRMKIKCIIPGSYKVLLL